MSFRAGERQGGWFWLGTRFECSGSFLHLTSPQHCPGELAALRESSSFLSSLGFLSFLLAVFISDINSFSPFNIAALLLV